VVAADFDGDKDVDLAVGFSNGAEIHVLANDGRGDFTASTVARRRTVRSATCGPPTSTGTGRPTSSPPCRAT
jgi:hypothetical protein